MNSSPQILTADYADAADKGHGGRGSVSASSAPSVVKKPGWFRSWLETFARAGGEIEVRIGENERGGWAIFPVNAAARTLFCGNAEAGNFGTYADAYQRAHRDNCWTVVEPKVESPEPRAQSQTPALSSQLSALN